MVKNNFGLRGILHHYSLLDYLKDIILPFLFSFIVMIFAIYKKCNSYGLLVNIIEMALNIIPALFSLLLTAYLFLLTFLQTDKLKVLFDSNDGKKLLLQLNSSFALCVLVAAISLAVSLVIYVVIKLGFSSSIADYINYCAVFFILLQLSFLVKIQLGIVIDLYNCGQATFYIK